MASTPRPRRPIHIHEHDDVEVRAPVFSHGVEPWRLARPEKVSQPQVPIEDPTSFFELVQRPLEAVSEARPNGRTSSTREEFSPERNLSSPQVLEAAGLPHSKLLVIITTLFIGGLLIIMVKQGLSFPVALKKILRALVLNMWNKLKDLFIGDQQSIEDIMKEEVRSLFALRLH